ncbi:MAG: cation:proton antiporter [Candidatus Auribacterota bacterium]|jgi:Kef-type K+ transport system membrane component KefB/Trk K+ transport system NAD-binding subunit|nr:cation:proton antiporter [Candidatus Auribacterota bacterium]
MGHGNTFFEVSAILGLATILGIVGKKLRQPLLIMFLATGILSGPSCLGLIGSYDQIELLAHMGISLLLFIVGLKLDLKLIRTTGPVALATGLGQIIFTSAIGFVIALSLGIPVLSSAYVAVALTFSSTIIIVKLLSDKKEIDSLHGQIAIGFLIVQDIAAILALVGLTTFGQQVSGETSFFVSSILITLKGLGFLAVIALLMRYVLPRLVGRLAHSNELLTLFAIAWAVFLGAGSELLGFSKEVGAFLAGISLASTSYRDSIGARLTSIRDFLLLFFFIALGARLDWSTVGSQVNSAVLLSLFVLIGNPLIVLVIMGIMGYRRRTGFLAGLTVAQISEFSLIVAALGLSIGHINQETMGLITLVGGITIFASTYMILYSGSLYRILSGPLKIFELRNPYRETSIDELKDDTSVDVILVGLGNYGSGLAEYLLRRDKIIIGVDFDPGALEKWRSRGISVLYGDMADPDIHDQLPLRKARWIVSTVRSKELNSALLHNLKNLGYTGNVALTATNKHEAAEFENMGAKVIFRPFADAAEQAADTLVYAMDFLPENVNWPIAFREVLIRPDVSVVGQTIRDIPLRSMTGASILAISRAGRIYYDPDPDHKIYPGDRVVIMGSADELKQAEILFREFNKTSDTETQDRFAVAEIQVADNSDLAGRTLADIRFRQKHGVTVVGIRRADNRIVTPSPAERIFGNDILVVVGNRQAIEKLKLAEPL